MAVTSFPFTQAVGTQTYGPLPIADNLHSAMLMVSNWPEANNTIALQLEISINGGPWNWIVKTNPQGGARTPDPDNGSTATGVVISQIWPGINRQVRAIVTVAGGSVSATLTVTTS